MHNVVDLTLCAAARRALERVLDERGLAFFVRQGRGRAPHLDARRIAWIVEAAARQAGPSRRRDADALARTRRVVRRELIRRIAGRMVSAGL